MSYLRGQAAKASTRLYKNVAATGKTIPQMWYNARDGIHGAQQGSAVDRDLAQARVMMAEGIIGACVGEVMAAAKKDGEVKAQSSFDVMKNLLCALKRQGDEWDKNRLMDSKLTTAYFPDADAASINDA